MAQSLKDILNELGGDEQNTVSNNVANTSAKNMDAFLKDLIGETKNNIIAVGVGGAGCNAINRLATSGFSGPLTVAANTDARH
ncbi:MAG: hypothetical protein VW394_07235, partial [Candidatus Heimdallarchaeota archaeon]